ncbi:MAG: amidohydrolase, partial [Gammaproteobacteria bacterium]|nr:amidohydrolase [Gammaproteobacteria bacterium]
MTELTPGSDEWLAQIQETIVDPERAIVDPHHHLWGAPRHPYLLEDLWRDTDSGHRIEQTVFLECGTNYRDTGSEHLRSVGETEFVAGVAAASREGKPGQAEIAAIVARADLTLAEGVE